MDSVDPSGARPKKAFFVALKSTITAEKAPQPAPKPTITMSPFCQKAAASWELHFRLELSAPKLSASFWTVFSGLQF